ncbi:hypothetical protein DRN73_04575 [Candidatus Pacearchaeota archaeon]|nr:MAG: hypothetical protein DRN73_04575 [Candidatus Pacearchaeota archaeon]
MKKSVIIGIVIVIAIALGIYLYTSSGPSNCAQEGELFSNVFTDKYPEHCCEGLMDWHSGMDTSISIADTCYQTGLLSGWPVGTCLNCGNNICEDIETPCNCPEDCLGKGKSEYLTVEEFCTDGYDEYCENIEPINQELCNLCQ